MNQMFNFVMKFSLMTQKPLRYHCGLIHLTLSCFSSFFLLPLFGLFTINFVVRSFLFEMHINVIKLFSQAANAPKTEAGEKVSLQNRSRREGKSAEQKQARRQVRRTSRWGESAEQKQVRRWAGESAEQKQARRQCKALNLYTSFTLGPRFHPGTASCEGGEEPSLDCWLLGRGHQKENFINKTASWHIMQAVVEWSLIEWSSLGTTCGECNMEVSTSSLTHPAVTYACGNVWIG